MNFTIGKRFIFICFLSFVIAAIFFSYNYSSLISSIKNEFNKHNKKDIEYIISNLQKNFLINDEENINNILEVAVNTTNISNIKIVFKSYLFTKEGLIKNSAHPTLSDWKIEDVTVDVKNGYVKHEENNYFKLYTNNKLEIKEPILFKLFLYKDGKVLNSISKLTFYYEHVKAGFNSDDLGENQRKVTTLYFFNQHLANVEYFVDDRLIQKKIEELKDDYILYFFITITLIGIIIYLIYFIFIKNVLLDSIIKFRDYLKDVLDNNMVSRVMEKSGDEHLDESIVLMNKVLKKYSAVLNELNINKDILERKVYVDDLTGLSNQKVFELDLKNMFIVGSDGFVGSIKLDYLGNFTKEFGSALANHLIEEFSNVVQNKFYEHQLGEATLYRFFGSEFAMILKNEKEEKVRQFCQDLENELIEMEERYEIKGKLAYYSLIPFDKYGTINSILQSMTEVYNKVKDSGSTYHIVSTSEVLDKFKDLEENVKDIISNNSFELSYGFNTVNDSEDEKVIMKDAIPLLLDTKGENLQIGTFISVAEKMNMGTNFDKAVIQKVVDFVKSNDVDYVIAINLSMLSLKDKDFMNWLHSVLLFEKEISKYLVFSLTSYTVSTNVELFKTFISEVHRYGAKIILKRYSTNDFSLEELKNLDLDYIRVSKDYTNGISNDRDKKHFLRTLVNLGQENNTLILGDGIKDIKDIETSFSIGIDGNSSY